MSAHAETRGPAGLIGRIRGAGGDSWSLGDKIGLASAWAAGILLCLIAAAIVLYMFIRGVQYLDLGLIFSHPQAGLDQTKSGGFLDPLEGTLALTVIATLIAAPVGVGIAVWLTEYGRPSWLARAVESGVEIVAGTPSIVLAIFGLLVFQQGIFSFLSYEATAGVAFGRSFFIAGTIMSLIALPLVVGAGREALHSIPRHVREASYALGKDRISTIRRVLLPASRRGIGTGVALGMGRIVGDTAIVVVLLGATLQNDPQGDIPGLGFLQGTGSTLTTYVYNNSPVGEGGSPEKAYAAAFVLLLIVIGLNFAVDMITRGEGAVVDSLSDGQGMDASRTLLAGAGQLPPPVRRIAPAAPSTIVPPPVGGNGHAPEAGGTLAPPKLQRLERPDAPAIERMRTEQLSIAYGEKPAVNAVSLEVRQGEVLALIGPSGCGKTTLLRSLNRLVNLTPTAVRGGRILLDGEDVDGFDVTHLRRRVGMLFQQPNPFPMSIFDNVAYGLRERGSKKPSRRALEPEVTEALHRAGLLEEVKDNLDHPALALSGGQQQRLCIARSLAVRPEVLLLDEPCSALDPISTQVIEETIVGLRSEVAIVIVTHNLQQAQRVADHVAFMYLGDLIEYGEVEQVFGAPTAERTREYVSGGFG